MLKYILSALVFLTSAAYAHQEGLSQDAEIALTEQIREEQNQYFEQLQQDILNGVPVDVAGDSCKYISSIFTPPISRVVTLTFDDGISSKHTPVVLDILKKHGVKATFFLKGSNSVGKDKLLRRMVNEGHIVANHSYSHPNFHTLSRANQVSELTTTDSVLSPYMRDNMKLFRYPYGNSTCETNAAAKKLGYTGIVGWHVDTCDWAFAKNGYVTDKQAKTCGVKASNKANFAGHVISETKRRDGGILLLHDIHEKTAYSVEEIIVRLKREGFSFANLDEAGMSKFFR